MTININFVRNSIQLLIDYLRQRGNTSVEESNFILTGSASLHYSGNLEREPKDIDILIQAHNYEENHKKIKDIIFDFGRISGGQVKTSNSFGEDESIKEFISIKIQGIVWDFWITDTDVKTLSLKLPYSEIGLAHPDYTWSKKLQALGNRKDLQLKALQDIKSIQQEYANREVNVLNQILSQDCKKSTVGANTDRAMTHLKIK